MPEIVTTAVLYCPVVSSATGATSEEQETKCVSLQQVGVSWDDPRRRTWLKQRELPSNDISREAMAQPSCSCVRSLSL